MTLRTDVASPENAWLGTFVGTADGRILEADDAFLAMCGYERSDVPGLRWTDLTSPRSRDATRRMGEECATFGRTRPYEKEYIRKDGSRLPLLIFAHLIADRADAREPAYRVHVVDLTMAEWSTAVPTGFSGNELNFGVSSSSIVWRAEATGRNVYFNDAWYAFTGLSPTAANGHEWRHAVHADDVERVASALERAGADTRTASAEIRVRSATGEFEWFVVRASALRDEAGRVLQLHGTLTNVGRQKRSEREFAVLSALGSATASSRTLDATMSVVAKTLVEQGLGTLAVVGIVEEGGALMRVGALHHADRDANDALARRLRRSILAYGPFARDAGLLLERLDESFARNVAARIDGFTPSATIAVPILDGGLVTGVLVLARSGADSPFVDDDRSFFEAVADYAGASIEAARVHERERTIASTLQEAVLPASLPTVPGLRFDAAYRAGKAESLVGGDWYDAFRLPDGRCVLSIGDVCGSGLIAATVMAEIRQSMRGVAAIDATPNVMLGAADRILADGAGLRYATAWIGILDPIDFTLVYAGAGHPAPVLCTASGDTVRLDGPGLPLGLRDLADGEPDVEMTLEPGSTIVLFTDGLIEFDRDLLAAEAKLERLVASSPERSANALVNDMLDGAAPHDDIAILVLTCDTRLRDVASAPVFRWSFDTSDGDAARRARSGVSEILAARGGTRADASTWEVVFAELVGNAVRYAPGEVRITLDCTGAKPVAHVVDTGPGFYFSAHLPSDAMSEGGRGLYIVSKLAAAFRVIRRPAGGSRATVVLPMNLSKR